MARRLTLILPLFALGLVNVIAAEIPHGYREVAAEYALPPQLLYAVALTESRRRLADGRLVPWPWTLNIEGKAYYFAGKAAAVQALRAYLASGRRSVAVGLMQKHWRWHAARLRDPALALDPYYNLRLGAAYLHHCHHRRGSWSAAIACYHGARDPAASEAYLRQVERQLARLE